MTRDMTKIQTAKKETAGKKLKSVSLEKKRSRAGWMFVLPFVLGFLIIYLPIVVDSLIYSFNHITVKGAGWYLDPVGFTKYSEALSYTPTNGMTFVETLTSGLTQLIIDVPAIIIFSLFMAVLLNKKMFGRAAFRAIFFVPVIMSTGVIASIDMNNILNESMSSGSIDDGSGATAAEDFASSVDLTRLFEGMQIGDGLLNIVTEIVSKIYSIITRSGVQMLIFLAGLQSVSPAIYEACSIDGASGWETFWKITFKMLMPMVLVNAVYTIIDSFTMETNSVMMYIDEVYSSVVHGRELSTAMSWIYFIIVLLIILLVAGVLSARVFYQRRD